MSTVARDRRARRRVRREFRVLGRELVRIRDLKMWSAGYASFEAYVDEFMVPKVPADWKLTRDQARRFLYDAIEFAEQGARG